MKRASNETMSLAALVSAAFAADNTAPPCFYWARCHQCAALEKAGRSVCRPCSAMLCGNEYPLRSPSAESLYASGRVAAEALDMLETLPLAGSGLRGSTEKTRSDAVPSQSSE